MKNTSVSLLIIYILFSSGKVLSYEIETHQEISQKALDSSMVTTDETVLTNLGLQPLSAKQKFLNSQGVQHRIDELIQDGAGFEDNLPGSRFVHHFYDPVHDLPLTDYTAIDQLGSTIFFGGWLADPIRSPDWALEDVGDISVQEYSWKDARLHFLCAVTSGTSERCLELGLNDTNKEWGLTFQTLGHIIHHIQDMAQPQHTRNEKHPFPSADWYEKYTGERPNLPLTGYGPVQFDTARKFWTGEGKGLADFSNFNFVTRGANRIKPECT